MNYGSASSGSLSALQLQRLIEIGRALTSNLDHESLLREIAEAAHAITGARYAALGVLNEARTELDQFITVGIDAEQHAQIGDLPSGLGVLGVLIENPRPLRLGNVGDHPDSYGFPTHHPKMHSFLGVPIMIGGVAWGNLYLTDKQSGQFDDEDEAAVSTLAAWASIAIRNARSIRDDRVRAAVESAESERKRWARELHDETLQSLGGLKVQLSGALRRDDEALRDAVGGAIEEIGLAIENLRALITELRPAALDDLGLGAALEGLVARTTAVTDTKLELDFDMAGGAPLPAELELAIYRIVQESVTNTVKHAAAPHVWVRIERRDGELEISVRDDGSGFEPLSVDHGFGLTGMRERMALLDGEFEVISAPGMGTTITATLPVRGAR